jgi:hypothetical protein
MLVFFMLVALSGMSQFIIVTMGISVILAAFYGFAKTQKKLFDISPENVFSVPAFIVLPSGEISKLINVPSLVSKLMVRSAFKGRSLKVV